MTSTTNPGAPVTVASPTFSAVSSSSYDMVSSLSSSFTSAHSRILRSHDGSSDEDDEIVIWSGMEGDSSPSPPPSSASGSEEDDDDEDSNDASEEFISQRGISDTGLSSDAEDDFVVLSRAAHPRTVLTGLTPPTTIGAIRSTQVETPKPKTGRRRKPRAKNPPSKPAVGVGAQPTTSSTTSVSNKKVVAKVETSAHEDTGKAKKNRRKASKAKPPTPTQSSFPPTSQVVATRTGFGSRPVVDDVSESASVNGDEQSSPIYQEAVNYISSYLSNPTPTKDRPALLALLQSLIIELDLIPMPTLPDALPTSLTSARALLKSRAFVNIREYVAVREDGIEALRSVMHPSRSALQRDIRRNRDLRAPKGWVKERGLGVLLVQCF